MVERPIVAFECVLLSGLYAVPILPALAVITWKYYAVYIAIDIFYVLLIYFYFPETKGLSIEEVSLVFDYGTKEGRNRAAAALDAHDMIMEQKIGSPDHIEEHVERTKPGAEHIEA